VDTATTNERLITARARLASAIEHSLVVPGWLAQPAQQCLIDLDCALSGGLSDSRARMLLAQVDALISVVEPAAAKGRRDDAGSR
jgi:hypothetical protein